MPIKPTQVQQQVRKRSYLARDFDGFRSALLNYARLYYPDRINDFSENSMGGLFLDLASYVGDNLSFYLDHQFNELDPTTAVETANLQRALVAAGVPIYGAAPAQANCKFTVEVPATTLSNGGYEPNRSLLPTIDAGTIVSTTGGIQFTLLEKLNFAETVDGAAEGKLKAEVVTGTTSNGTVISFLVSLSGVCVSGNENTTTISIGDFVAFRRITLPDSDVYEITNVYDSFGNYYYQVNDLSEDVVYKSVANISADAIDVKSVLQPVYAPYRFTRSMDIQSRLTTLTFGGGSAASLQDDIIPDPSDFALSLPFSEYSSRTAIDPQKMLTTRTLGVAAENTTLTISYRYGGGLSHNVSSNTISVINDLRIRFPQSPNRIDAQRVVNTLSIINPEAAQGGENAPTTADLRELIPAIKNAQQRIVTKEDLLARTYTLPSNYGRIFRAGIRPNPDNPMATKLFVISRDSRGFLTQSSDTLKLNLAKHLNDYRMVTDAIDIFDAPLVNLTLKFRIVVDPRYNASNVIADVASELTSYFKIKNWQIDMPIIIADMLKLIFNVDGVVSMPSGDVMRQNDPSAPLTFGTAVPTGDRTYSAYRFSPRSNIAKGMIIPPEGGIFEVKYPEFDITGESV